MIDEDEKRDEMKRWKIYMKDDKGKKRKDMQKDMNDIFPEDNILDIITISRYDYHM